MKSCHVEDIIRTCNYIIADDLTSQGALYGRKATRLTLSQSWWLSKAAVTPLLINWSCCCIEHSYRLQFLSSLPASFSSLPASFRCLSGKLWYLQHNSVRETNAHPLVNVSVFWAGRVENCPGREEFCLEHIRDICLRASAPKIYRQTSNIRRALVDNFLSLRCSWSISSRHCSSYIFVLDLTPGFNGLGKNICKTRRGSFKFLGLGATYIRDFRVVFHTAVVFEIHVPDLY